MDQQQPQPPPRITFEEIVVWLDERRKLVLAAIVLAGLAGLAWVVLQSRTDAREQEATAALFQLQLKANATTNGLPASAYQELLSDLGASGAAQHARLRAATSLYSEGRFSEAQQAFEAFQADFANSPLLPEAAFGAAVSLEAQGKNAEALVRYQELTTRFSDSSLVGRARLAQARLFELQGDQQQAFRIYQELGRSAPGEQTTPLQMDATIAAGRLLKENPSLIQTNPPAITPAITPLLPTNLPPLTSDPAGS
jgi:TolA-binding protein